MAPLKKAFQAYRDQQFEQAFIYFHRAGLVYGWFMVYESINRCLKNIHFDKQEDQDDKPLLESDGYDILDPASKLMLCASGQNKLSHEERCSHLAQYEANTWRKSNELSAKRVNVIPDCWPKDMNLRPLPDSTNDWAWYLLKKSSDCSDLLNNEETGLSVVIPTYNRHQMLSITLACLVNQQTNYAFEVIVADDGSRTPVERVIEKFSKSLDIKYVRQEDEGYRLCAVRNLGLAAAKYKFVAILDCDMAPNPNWIQSYMTRLVENDSLALIGPRKYVDTKNFIDDDFTSNTSLIEALPETFSSGRLGRKHIGNISVDWRLDYFEKTEDLRLSNEPFRYFSGGNVAFARKWLNVVGGFDEEFTHWGGEDCEFGYRLYRKGCYFKVERGAMAYHQEPPGLENETNREEGHNITRALVREKVPYIFRKPVQADAAVIHKVPLVSIYIPAYNCESTIVRCIESALNQTVVDLEVCVCNDGSTDRTRYLLDRFYSEHPRVRFIHTENGGIGRASNIAVELCKGFYIGQLDSDDFLESDAVALCLEGFFQDQNLVCVYSAYRNVQPNGQLIGNGFHWPVYSREKLTASMICHPFRMFTIRAWSCTKGFDENLLNAVDYDMYLQLSEVGPFKHINAVSYNRTLHAENTSIKHSEEQRANHIRAVNASLLRQGILEYEYDLASEVNENVKTPVFVSVRSDKTN